MPVIEIPETSTFVQARYPDDALVFGQIEAKAASLRQAWTVQPNVRDIYNPWSMVVFTPASAYLAAQQQQPNVQVPQPGYPQPSALRNQQIEQIQLYSGQLLGSP